MKSRSKVIEVNFEELTALLERARQGPLSQEDCERLEAAIHALSRLIEKIGEKNTTISQLRALLMKPSTEKTRKVLEQAGIKTSPPNSSPPHADPKEKPRPGHGRNGEAAYRGTERIKVPHGSLKPGDHCPKCLKGKVYPTGCRGITGRPSDKPMIGPANKKSPLMHASRKVTEEEAAGGGRDWYEGGQGAGPLQGRQAL